MVRPGRVALGGGASISLSKGRSVAYKGRFRELSAWQCSPYRVLSRMEKEGLIEAPKQRRPLQKRLFALFSHQLTDLQRNDAHRSLGVAEFVWLPPGLQALWRQIPAELEGIDGYLSPFKEWLAAEGRAGDYVLIQGDFGATWIMVNHAFQLGLVPVYSTTERQAGETITADGAVQLVHHFRHRRFRRYGA